jgi:hypothetical protein
MKLGVAVSFEDGQLADSRFVDEAKGLVTERRRHEAQELLLLHVHREGCATVQRVRGARRALGAASGGRWVRHAAGAGCGGRQALGAARGGRWVRHSGRWVRRAGAHRFANSSGSVGAA